MSKLTKRANRYDREYTDGLTLIIEKLFKSKMETALGRSINN